MPWPWNRETTYFPRTVDKVVAVRDTLQSEQFQIYGAALEPFSFCLSREDVSRAIPFILPSRSVTLDSNLHLMSYSCIFISNEIFRTIPIFRARFTCANITGPLRSLLKRRRRLRRCWSKTDPSIPLSLVAMMLEIGPRSRMEGKFDKSHLNNSAKSSLRLIDSLFVRDL